MFRVTHLAGLAAALALALSSMACGGESDRTTTSTTSPSTSTKSDGAPRLTRVVGGLDSPVQVIQMPDSPNHIWVLERGGRILSVRSGRVEDTPVGDLTATTKSGGEQGLLSLALHPNFPATDLAYIHRSDINGDTLVTEHRVDAGHISAEPTRILLQVKQPYANHNGGSLAFGPDGLLYLGLGDGGSGGDPDGNAQDQQSRLGKLLRLDLGRPIDLQVAAYGLRNPWRLSFDPQTGNGWIGDVGQSSWEEVDLFPRDSPVLNYGWSVREGRHAYDGGGSSAFEGTGRLTEPVAEYSHDDGCSITGGVVVRDPKLPSLSGRYLYTDYCSGTFWSIPADGSGTPRKEPFSANAPVSIDVSADRGVYVTSIHGEVLRVTATG